MSDDLNYLNDVHADGVSGCRTCSGECGGCAVEYVPGPSVTVLNICGYEVELVEAPVDGVVLVSPTGLKMELVNGVWANQALRVCWPAWWWCSDSCPRWFGTTTTYGADERRSLTMDDLHRGVEKLAEVDGGNWDPNAWADAERGCSRNAAAWGLGDGALAKKLEPEEDAYEMRARWTWQLRVSEREAERLKREWTDHVGALRVLDESVEDGEALRGRTLKEWLGMVF